MKSHSQNRERCQRRYRSPFDFDTTQITSVRERDALSLSAVIREKPDWASKIDNPDIVNKWQEEVLKDGCLDVFVFAIEHAKWCRLRRQFVLDAQLEDSSVDGVHQSDNLITEKLRNELESAVAQIKNQAGYVADVHPGSNGRVIDIIHPSLYPFMYGISRESETVYDQSLLCDEDFDTWALSGTATSTGKEIGWTGECFTSAKFQWLPTEMKVDAVYGEGQFRSYINNIDPKDRIITPVIESIALRFIPLWVRVLVDLQSPRIPRDMYVSYPTAHYDDKDDWEDMEDDSSGNSHDGKNDENDKAGDDSDNQYKGKYIICGAK